MIDRMGSVKARLVTWYVYYVYFTTVATESDNSETNFQPYKLGEYSEEIPVVGTIISTVQPEVLRYLIKKSSHQPVCVFYKSKVNSSFEQELIQFWEEVTKDDAFSSWILRAVTSKEPSVPVLRCHIGSDKVEDYDGKFNIKKIHTFLEQLNQRCLQEADPATIDDILSSHSLALTAIVFLEDGDDIDIESDLIQLQETFREELLILLVHSGTSEESSLIKRFQVTRQPAILLLDSKEWSEDLNEKQILKRFEGALATIDNMETYVTLYLSSISILNLDSFQSEIMSFSGNLFPILVCFYALWGNDVSSYISALQRSVNKFEALDATLRYGSVDVAMQHEVVSRYVNATYAKSIPFSVLFWWEEEINEAEPRLLQRLFTKDIPTPWNIAEFLEDIGMPLQDEYGNSIKYTPWEGSMLSHGFSLWSSMPCITGAINGSLCQQDIPSHITMVTDSSDIHGNDSDAEKVPPKKPILPRVTDANWHRTVEQSQTRTKNLHQLTQEIWRGDVTPTILVVFIQDGCGSCGRKMGMFEKLATSISFIGGASIYLHNCTSDPKTCDRLKIHGFPTVIAFRGYGQVASRRCVSMEQQWQYMRMDYHGVIEEAHILDWFSQITVAAVQKVTLTEFEAKKQVHDVVLLATLYPHSIARQYLPIISGPDSWYPYDCYRVACERLYGKASCYAALTKNLQKRDLEFSQEEQRMVVTQVEMFRRDGVQSMVFSLGKTMIKTLQDESDKQLHQFHSPHRYNLRPSQRCEDDHIMCTNLIAAFVRDHSRLPVTRITLASFHTHGSPSLDIDNEGSVHSHGHPVMIALAQEEDLEENSTLMQELTDSAYQLYNQMVIVALSVDEFPQWASHFVPRGYSRQIFENSNSITEDMLPSLYVYPRLCIIHEEDHRHAAFYPPVEEFQLMPRNSSRQIPGEVMIKFAENFLADPDKAMIITEQF